MGAVPLDTSALRTSQPVPMLDFSRQYAAIREEVLTAIEAVCDSQRFILGPAVSNFEAASALACSVPHAVGCASGTDALWLALEASGIGPGDTVVTTPFSFFASASSVLRCGARLLFADIDPLTFNISPAAVATLLHAHPEIKAILPVHLYGQCADWDALTAVATPRDLVLIEDAAQAFGALWRGTPAGALGRAAAFSFYPTKNLSAFGDAGLVTTSDSVVAERAAMLRAHGMRKRYIHDEIGWNSRLDSLQAAVLEVKLGYLPRWNQQRRDKAAVYDNLFRAAGLVGRITLPYSDPRATPVFHQYVIRAPRRDALRQFLTDGQIGSEVYYPLPLHLQTALSFLGHGKGDFPHAEQAAAEVLALPLYPEIREDEQAAVVDTIASFYS